MADIDVSIVETTTEVTIEDIFPELEIDAQDDIEVVSFSEDSEIKVVTIGTQGPPGIKGDTGEQGIQGLKGDKGDKGDAGEQGIPGVAASFLKASEKIVLSGVFGVNHTLSYVPSPGTLDVYLNGILEDDDFIEVTNNIVDYSQLDLGTGDVLTFKYMYEI